MAVHKDAKQSSSQLVAHVEQAPQEQHDYEAVHVDEQDLNWRPALQRYRPAVCWALAMSLQGVMEGYNISLGGNLLVFPAFQEKYGEYFPDLGWQITFQWQMAIGLGATIGGIFGVLLGGVLVERLGPKLTIMVSQILIAGTIFISFYAVNVEMMFGGSIANGVPWGVLSVVGSIYSSEVCPTSLRGYIINFTNVAWLFGTLIASIVTKPLVNLPSEWSYRIPFAVQWVWPIPLFVIAYLAPDSPWRLLRKGDYDGAVHAMKRLSNGLTDEQIHAKLAVLKRTNELELEMQTESSYKDCFQRTNLPRTEIACLALMTQGVTGLTLAGAPTYFMLQVGLSADNALTVGIVTNVIGIIGNLVCWPLMFYYGRRPLLIFGLASVSLTLLLIGILDVSQTPAALWTQSVLCILWSGLFAAFVAPESYTIAAEISATRVRSQTVSLAKCVFGISSLASGLIQTYTVNPTGADIRGKSAYIWCGCTVMLLFWAIFRLPETKGRTYEELDTLFSSNIKARGFKGQLVELDPDGTRAILHAD